MMSTYLTFSISISVISWIVGMAVNAILRKTEFYEKKLSNLNFVENKKLNKIIGIGIFKWIVKNTFFKFFNQKLKLKKKIKENDLNKLRSEMTISEIDHLIGFVFVSIFALAKFYNFNFLFGFTIMIVNVLMNLYPSLLQQENKRRINKLINKTVINKVFA
ncbi:glycosyl-4,4'-diaponeurosporenoate acyltransferase CrtO family protein [Pedobacter jamesrossensis]|uniref:Glycosyl-4,4'-diaponeurosporenoate acyltransferase n=1 Tax=Pedobacter jamesrossensis TaxID=1908238 RepID=A0ABV8NN13_9SPHI